MQLHKAIQDQIDPYVQSVDPETRFDIMTIVFFIPAFVILFFLGIIPLFYAIYLSLHEARLVSVGAFVGLDNYVTLVTDPEFVTVMVRSVIFGVGNVVFQISMGLVFALALRRQFLGNGIGRLVDPFSTKLGNRAKTVTSSVFRSLIILPYLVPVIAMVFMWEWLLNAQYGIIPEVAVRLGIIPEPFYVLGRIETAMAAIIVTNSWKYIAFAVILFLARLQAINDRLYDAAKIAGASDYQMFRDITLPHLMSTILLVGLLRFIWMFNKFDSIWLFTSGGPADATTTLPVQIFKLSFQRYDMGLGSAAAVTLFLLLSVFGLIYFVYANPSDEIEPMR